MSGRHLGCGAVGNYCAGGTFGCRNGGSDCGDPPGAIVIRPSCGCALNNLGGSGLSCICGNEMQCAIASLSGKCCRKPVFSVPPVKPIQITFKCPTYCCRAPVLMDPCCPPPVIPPTCPTPPAPGSCCGAPKIVCRGR